MSSLSEKMAPLALLLFAAACAGSSGVHASDAPVPEHAPTAQATLDPQASGVPDAPVLRVCADPNNMPFSNRAEEGFENRIAEVVAQAMGRRVEYTWWPQRRGFIRNTLRAGKCDVVIGVPTSFELALTTAPYYRSTYVFVYPTARSFEIRSMNDSILRELRIGVHMVGDDYSNTPGAAALGHRGMIENLVGYSIYGDYSKPHPPSRLVEAVAQGEVDVAIAWGPLAGYFAPRQPIELEVVPVRPQIDVPFTPFVFDIAMAVRRGDDSLAAALERVLEREATAIRSILEDYGVPLVGTGGAAALPGAAGRRTG